VYFFIEGRTTRSLTVQVPYQPYCQDHTRRTLLFLPFFGCKICTVHRKRLYRVSRKTTATAIIVRFTCFRPFGIASLLVNTDRTFSHTSQSTQHTYSPPPISVLTTFRSRPKQQLQVFNHYQAAKAYNHTFYGNDG
jgi:hypothetical protein